ncbi:MAG: AAA family ATPase [Elusimicrobia bacterium]|nr:AAA family ATPase [Elusimicrobiota bacterium]
MKKIHSNKDYLKRLLEILEAPELSLAVGGRAERSPVSRPVRGKQEKQPDPKKICSAALAQLRELFAMGKQGLKEGVKIPFAQICRKHKFDENETLILAVFVAMEISGRDMDGNPFRGHDNVLKIIFLLLDRPKIEILPYFLSSGRLKKSGLFLHERYGREEGLRSVMNLKESVIELLLKGGKPTKKKKRAAKPARPRQIAEQLNLSVIAQETAKRQLSTVAFQHMERAGHPAKANIAAPRLNTLLLGPTGCGKTYITRRLAEILGAPIAFCDATQYTETGYVGSNVEEMLIKLAKAAGDNLKTAEYGIIFIDEIDKIRAQNVGESHHSERDVSGLSVQQELLKMLEGETLTYEKFRGDGCGTYQFNVKNVLFIAAGAFQGLGEIINDRIKTKKQIGFKDQASAARVEIDQANLLHQAKPQDIIKYGFIPELIGRFPNIIALDRLTKADFLSILGNPRTSLLEHYTTFFAQNGIELEIPPAFLEEMADKAATRDLGARGLNAAVENFFSELMYELLDRKSGTCEQKVNIMDCLHPGRLKELLA